MIELIIFCTHKIKGTYTHTYYTHTSRRKSDSYITNRLLLLLKVLYLLLISLFDFSSNLIPFYPLFHIVYLLLTIMMVPFSSVIVLTFFPIESYTFFIPNLLHQCPTHILHMFFTCEADIFGFLLHAVCLIEVIYLTCPRGEFSSVTTKRTSFFSFKTWVYFMKK